MNSRTSSESAVEGPAYELHPVGRVESPLKDLDAAPKQGDEGAPEAWLVFDADVRPALADLEVGADIIVLTWLHHASRDVLAVHPRGDGSRPLRGVFATRSADRPNPIGLHPVTIVAVDDLRVRVRNLEAIEGTLVLDVKPALEPIAQR